MVNHFSPSPRFGRFGERGLGGEGLRHDLSLLWISSMPCIGYIPRLISMKSRIETPHPQPLSPKTGRGEQNTLRLAPSGSLSRSALYLTGCFTQDLLQLFQASWLHQMVIESRLG